MEKRTYKLGSLFDGSGGFPLAGALYEIEPCWASEVEPYPIAVTHTRFPNMKHLGDISKINGADIITFGSPCQDLSVAGKRAGLKHEANGDEETTRSGLFMEAVRIIKEMRNKTNGQYPRFALWENVPGAFSSNKGEDFRIVLEELIKITEPTAFMPPIPKNGWAYADSYVGDGWSLAYRTFDAQYWGVPQRRRRIHLVADFRGECAGKVLFECQGVRGYFEAGRTPWQAAPAGAQGRAGSDDREGEGFDRSGDGGNRGRGLDAVGFPLGFRPENVRLYGETATTICNGTRPDFTNGAIEVRAEVLPFDTTQVTSPQNGSKPIWGDPCHPLVAQGYPPTVICKKQYLFENHSQDTRYKGPLDVCPMLPAQLGTGGNNTPFVVERCVIRFIVRRLIPSECARLQGFPDNWGHIGKKDSLTPEEFRFWHEVRNTHAAINGKKVQNYTEAQILTWYNKLWTDSAEYKMWGNGIALPPALYCMQGIVDALNREEEDDDWMA